MVRDLFKSTITRYQMLRDGDGVVAALSGGPDSTALLCLLTELAGPMGLRVRGAHYNHGLRGAESDGDEAFVREQCRRRGVALTVEHAPTPPAAGENVEQWAREARYRFFERVRAGHDLDRIALGHTRDDLAETLLMRLLRGSGLSGLACLRPVRGDGVIRPLIGIPRSGVLALLDELGQPYREDSSNRDMVRLRNRVRHELLPLLERNYNPRAAERLADTVGLLLDDEAFLQRQAVETLERMLIEDDGGQALSRTALADLPPALGRRVVREALRRCRGDLRGLDRGHVESVIALAASGAGGEKRLDLPGGLVVRTVYHRLAFEAADPSPDTGGWSRPLTIPGSTRLEACGLMAVATVESAPAAGGEDGWPDPGTTVLLDAAAIGEAEKILRSWKPGDRYRPEGAPGSRKVARMLIDARVPRHRRNRVPLLVVDGEPVWVPGHRPAEGCGWRPEKGGACIRLELRKM